MVLFAARRADFEVQSAIAEVRRKSADVIVVTDSDSLSERLDCSAAGPADCVFRPFYLLELAAKIRALQRPRWSDMRFAPLPGGDAVVDCAMLEIGVGARRRPLTKREIELLTLFARSSGGNR